MGAAGRAEAAGRPEKPQRVFWVLQRPCGAFPHGPGRPATRCRAGASSYSTDPPTTGSLWVALGRGGLGGASWTPAGGRSDFSGHPRTPAGPSPAVPAALRPTAGPGQAPLARTPSAAHCGWVAALPARRAGRERAGTARDGFRTRGERPGRPGVQPRGPGVPRQPRGKLLPECQFSRLGGRPQSATRSRKIKIEPKWGIQG